MALKACRECGRIVSDEAASCPHCGVPAPTAEKKTDAMNAAKEQRGFKTMGVSAPDLNRNIGLKKKSKLQRGFQIAAVGVLLLFVGSFVLDAIFAAPPTPGIHSVIATLVPAPNVAVIPSALSSPAWGDDPSIPPKCRASSALDNPRCATIVESRFDARNLRDNKRDSIANAAIEQTIQASRTMTGDTVADALRYLGSHTPFAAGTWSFVYSRSGAEYAVLSYGRKTGKARAADQVAFQNFISYDDDHDAEGAASIDSSQAVGDLVWKVDGHTFKPEGFYARMIALGPKAFAWAVNNGAKGFDNSGYNAELDADFSWFGDLDAGGHKLSDLADPTSPGMTFYSYADNSYVIQSPSFSCPGQTAGVFIIQAPNCEKQTAASKSADGSVLPFKIVTAVRNRAYQKNMVEAHVVISVKGGKPIDWLATGVYVAEHSIVRDVTFATVGVFIPNPWGDDSPQEAAELAKVYYAPNPSQSPWKDKWYYTVATAASSQADIEFDRLSNDLLDANIEDPDVRTEKADAAAKRIVIKKFLLRKNWHPRKDFWMNDEQPDRNHLHIIDSRPGVATSMSSLADCLTSNEGNAVISGCPDTSPDN